MTGLRRRFAETCPPLVNRCGGIAGKRLSNNVRAAFQRRRRTPPALARCVAPTHSKDSKLSPPRRVNLHVEESPDCGLAIAANLIVTGCVVVTQIDGAFPLPGVQAPRSDTTANRNDQHASARPDRPDLRLNQRMRVLL
jgi:hypothetical protein